MKRPQIICRKIEQYVEVRKYEVDKDGLVVLLRKAKKEVGLTNGEIARRMNVNLTKVEHWFRTDSSFSIPDKEIWLELKSLLQIKTDKFDKPIMETIIKLNEFDTSNRAYDIEGIAPTLTCDTKTTSKKIVNNDNSIRKLTSLEYWRLMGFKDEDYYKAKEVCNSNELYRQAGNSIVVNVLENIFNNLF